MVAKTTATPTTDPATPSSNLPIAAPEEDKSSSETMVKITIRTLQNECSVLQFPLHSLLTREEEMKRVKEQFSIDSSSWNGSRLFRWYSETGQTTFDVCPARDCAEQNLAHNLQWENWLTVLLEQYYCHGRLVIPHQTKGHELLLALEYFGILHQPQQLQFASYATYARVQHWSEYLTHRTSLGDAVADSILHCSQHQQSDGPWYFGTTLNPADQLQMDDGSPVTPLLLSNLVVNTNTSQQGSVASAAAVYDFFNVSLPEEDALYVDRAQAAAVMRQDFADYLQHSLSGVKVSFTIVLLTSLHGVVERAVLKAEVIGGHNNQASIAAVEPIPVVEPVIEPAVKSEEVAQPVEPEPAAPQIQHTQSHASAPLDEVLHRLRQARLVAQGAREVGDLGDGSPQRAADFPSEEENKDLRNIPVDHSALEAPVQVIRTNTEEQSTWSALTLPQALQTADDASAKSKRKQDSQKQQKKQEPNSASEHSWLQSGLLEQGISEKLGALLSVAETPDNKKGGIRESIAWLTGPGLCEYTATMMKEVSNFKIDGNCSMVDTSETKTQDTSLSDIPKKPGTVDIVIEQKKNKKSSTKPLRSIVELKRLQSEHHQGESAEHGFTLKDRLARFEHDYARSADCSDSHIDRRSVAMSLDRRSHALSEDHECREADTGFEVRHTEPEKLIASASLETEEPAVSVVTDSSPQSTETKTNAKGKSTPVNKTKKRGIKGLFRRRKGAI